MRLSADLLSCHSLFVEGFISRLRENPQRIEVQIVGPRRQNYRERINANRPEFIMIDGTEPNKTRTNRLCDLLKSFLKVTIFHHNLQEDGIQQGMRMQHYLREIKGLIEFVEQSHQMRGEYVS